MAALYIVRHGNTFEAGETPRRVGARTDLALTATGRAQAAALGRHFAAKGIGFARALSSPLQRTRATAAAILDLQPKRAGLEIAEFLTEIDHGPDEDRPDADIIARIGAEALAQWDMAAIAPAGWIVGGEQRIEAWRDFAARLADERPVLLVTSNGAARFALKAFELNPAGGGSLKLRTGAYGVIEAGADRKARLVEWDIRPD